jgi:hypothetical protein
VMSRGSKVRGHDFSAQQDSYWLSVLA